MKPRKLEMLFADDNHQLSSCVANYMSAKDEFECCDTAYTSEQFLRRLDEKAYDIIVMDLALSTSDPRIMKKISASKHSPAVIWTASLTHDNLIKQSCELGVDYFMVKPFSIDSLYQSILDLVKYEPETDEDDLAVIPIDPHQKQLPLDERITNLVSTTGISSRIKGFGYLCEAIKQVYYNRSLINAITKMLYPSVAEAVGTSASKVERAIRHAIELAWESNALDELNKRFIPNPLHPSDKPTNGEFIALLSDRLLVEDLEHLKAPAFSL